jgi:hypothetical protein
MHFKTGARIVFLALVLVQSVNASPFLQGRVTDEHGRPIEGATVRVWTCYGACFPRGTTLSDSDGRYVFSRRRHGTPIRQVRSNPTNTTQSRNRVELCVSWAHAVLLSGRASSDAESGRKSVDRRSCRDHRRCEIWEVRQHSWLTVAVRPEWVFPEQVAADCMNATNSDPFYGWPPGTVRVVITGSPETKNDLEFWRVKYDFQFNPEGYNPQKLEEGLRQLITLANGKKKQVPCTTSEGGSTYGTARPLRHPLASTSLASKSPKTIFRTMP